MITCERRRPHPILALRERGTHQAIPGPSAGPAVVAPLIRQLPKPPDRRRPAERTLSVAGSARLERRPRLDDVPQWATADRSAPPTPHRSLAKDLIARQERASRVTLCGYLVDVYCLGVKDTTARNPWAQAPSTPTARLFQAFTAPACPHPDCPTPRPRAVAYAPASASSHRQLCPDSPTSAHQPDPPDPFGREGKPFYISAPTTTPRRPRNPRKHRRRRQLSLPHAPAVTDRIRRKCRFGRA